MPFTLAELLTPQDAATLAANIRARCEAAGFPVDDWPPAAAGGFEESLLGADAAVLAARAGELIPYVAAGRFLDVAPLVEPDQLDAALMKSLRTLLARRFYRLGRREATTTIQNIRLTAVPAASGRDLQPGDIVMRASGTGNVYTSTTGGLLAPGATLDVTCEAAAPGAAYSDVDGTVTEMVKTYAGVTAVNRRRADFTDARVSGPSSGTVVGTWGRADVSPAATIDDVRVRVERSGEIGSALISISIDGGGTWRSAGPLPHHLAITGTGSTFVASSSPPADGESLAVLAFENGDAPSFIEGDIFTLQIGRAIERQGSDEEGEAAIAQRCRFRWPGLSDIPTESLIAFWAFLASPEVDKIYADADPNMPGGILATIASSAGPASPAALEAVQDFIAARLQNRGMSRAATSGSPEERIQVRSARPREIAPGGKVEVARAQLPTVRVAANVAWVAHLRSLPIGGTVRVAELVEAVMTAGAINILNPTLEKGIANIRLKVNEIAVPKAGTTLLNSLTWRPV